MILIEARNENDLGLKAATIIASAILENSGLNLGLATGSTPLETYRQLRLMYENKLIDFSKVKTFNLDEYVSLAKEHESSYHYYMNSNLFNYINIEKENTFIPDGNAKNLELECENFEKQIKSVGGIDLQLLGLGSNGHIAFNEPAESFSKKTHVVALTQNTINDNKRFFSSEEDVPKHAITMGISTIMKSKKILLLCYGQNKKEAFDKMVFGEVSPKNPASVLQYHDNVSVIYTGF